MGEDRAGDHGPPGKDSPAKKLPCTNDTARSTLSLSVGRRIRARSTTNPHVRGCRLGRAGLLPGEVLELARVHELIPCLRWNRTSVDRR
jgi:hypothetical protein